MRIRLPMEKMLPMKSCLIESQRKWGAKYVINGRTLAHQLTTGQQLHGRHLDVSSCSREFSDQSASLRIDPVRRQPRVARSLKQRM
uniref:Uncharacterized protein n=1 Tax=Steinernema glaseri TaxID=37863 RepID=A0A1I8AA85_9BILA